MGQVIGCSPSGSLGGREPSPAAIKNAAGASRPAAITAFFIDYLLT